MTKPRNFPERVNKRREAALARLPMPATHHKPSRAASLECERLALMSRCVGDASAIRTKKQRGGTSAQYRPQVSA